MKFELPGLSNDLLECILLHYCDINSLAKLWQAVALHKDYTHPAFALFVKVIEQRIRGLPMSQAREALLPFAADTTLLQRQQQQESVVDVNPTTTVAMLTRHLSLRLSSYEFCRTIPNVIWCGHMEFKDPMLPDWSTQHARVVLLSDDGDGRDWNIHDLKRWRSSFPVATKLISQMYNFVPVHPRGRLCGVSKKDAETLQDIRRRLESRDQVMVLRYRNDEGLILRLISPEQATRRLAPFSNLPHATGGTAFQSFPDGLLCCWESLSDDGGVNTPPDQLMESVDYITRSYNQLVRSTQY